MKKLLVLCLSLFLVFSCSRKHTTDASSGKYGSGGSDLGQSGDLKTVNFDYDKANLTPKAQEVLKENASWLKENKNLKIQIEGHCDSRGSIEYNLALGSRRATTVKDYLVNLGVNSKNILIISYGEERPLDFRENEIAWAKNRRANFVIIE
jgi:peptidoglycan-associated lipoprotein